jgi:hypothetical protein
MKPKMVFLKRQRGIWLRFVGVGGFVSRNGNLARRTIAEAKQTEKKVFVESIK